MHSLNEATRALSCIHPFESPFSLHCLLVFELACMVRLSVVGRVILVQICNQVTFAHIMIAIDDMLFWHAPYILAAKYA